MSLRRRMVRWGRLALLVVTATCLVLLLLGYVGVWWTGTCVITGIHQRTFTVQYFPPGSVRGTTGWHHGKLGVNVRITQQANSTFDQYRWWFAYFHFRSGPAGATPWLHELVIMIYPLRVAMVTGVLGLALLFVPMRRANSGVCQACGYDRSGLSTEAPCPECGAASFEVAKALE